ncbi:MAG: DUF4139 domain-containing protein [Burkholderiales bacterium]|nr:DUF4139 domain-containing protein [Phycisphaerae bacterium]
MRKLIIRSLVIAAAVSQTPLFAQTAPGEPGAAANAPVAAAQQALPVKSVVLFSSGVGYFEHFGPIKGDGNTELRFKTAQINDILKSLVLQDMDGGKVSTVQYPSQDPVEKTLKSFQVDITANPALAELLNQLRGAKVTLQVATDKYSGMILGVEKRATAVTPQTTPVDIWIVNLIDGANIRQIELAKINDVKLEDATLQDELTRALQALAKARDQDKKSVVINFTGQGERRIRLGYVVESPIWKTSYRLVMGDKDTSLQGWAIVENQTDNDWDNVQLSLVSGRPISFSMNLYQPLYVARPVVQMELYQSLRPQIYADGMEHKQLAASAAPMAPGARQSRARTMGGAGGGGGFGAEAASDSLKDSADNQPMDMTSSVQSIASAAKLGELFQYTVGNISLPRQKSAMIPIITDKVDVERVSIYNQNVLAKHPLNGAMVTNSTDKHLLQGPITVFDANSYAGDAQIDNVPPGQKRLLSYGIDLQVQVQTKPESANQLMTGKIVKGVLHLTRKTVQSQTYDVNNKSDHAKTIVVEHPLNANWKLVNSPEPFEKTDALYRFKLPVEKAEQKSIKVSQETTQGEAIAMIDGDIGTLLFYARQGEIPEPARAALTEAAKRQQALVDFERQINEKQQLMVAVTQEQGRIRENMKTVDKASPYYNRLLGKLNDQESQIEKMQTETDALRTQRDAARKSYEEYLNGLSVG